MDFVDKKIRCSKTMFSSLILFSARNLFTYENYMPLVFKYFLIMNYKNVTTTVLKTIEEDLKKFPEDMKPTGYLINEWQSVIDYAIRNLDKTDDYDLKTELDILDYEEMEALSIVILNALRYLLIRKDNCYIIYAFIIMNIDNIMDGFFISAEFDLRDILSSFSYYIPKEEIWLWKKLYKLILIETLKRNLNRKNYNGIDVDLSGIEL